MTREEEIKQIDQERDISPDGASPENAPWPGKLEETTFPEGGARAWSVALGAAGVLFCTFGYVNAFGIYEEYYLTHQLQDHSPSAISWIGSLQVFFLLGGTLFGGTLFDRYGGIVLWPPAITLVFSVMMTSICQSYYQFVLAQGVLGGISMGMTMAPAMAAIGQYFRKNRGAAMGIGVAGSSLGGVIFPIALSRMFDHPSLGFGWTVRIAGFMMLAVLLVSCMQIRARLPPRKGQFFLPSAFKELPFITLLLAGFLMFLGVFTPFFYLPDYGVFYGMSTQLASYLIAILNGSSLFGRLIPGVLADKFGALNLLFLSAICSGILILCWTKITTSASILVFSALYGFFSGAIISLMSVSLAHIPKDPRDIGTYMGMGMATVSLAALAGPPISGALVTNYRSFDQASYFSGTVVTAGGIAVLLVKHVSGKGLFGKV